MNMQELADKFRDCTLHGRKYWSNQEIDRVIQQVGELEEVDDVGQIIQLLG